MKRKLLQWGFQSQWKLLSFFQQKQLELLSNKFQKIKIKQTFKWYENSHTFLNQFFTRFVNSKSNSGFVSGLQLVFVTGAQGIGKSKFIKQNLQNFRIKKQKRKLGIQQINEKLDKKYLLPQVIQDNEKMIYDNQHYIIIAPQIHQDLSFYAFLDILEKQIIKNILQKNDQISDLLSLDIIYDILIQKNSQQYIQIYAKDYILALLNDLQILLLKQQDKKQLSKIYDQFLDAKIQCKLIFKQKYKSIIQILNKYYKSEIQTAIKFIVGILHKIQYQYRPQIYTYSYYRTGIETTNFLFDIINFLTGIDKINLKNLKKYYSNPLQHQQKNFILQGNHIDSVLVLKDIFKSKLSKSKEFLQWFDHIVFRTSNTSNLRTHFPIIIELKNSTQIKDLWRLGRLNFQNPLVIDIHGYRYSKLKQSNLMQLFQLPTAKKLYPFLGSHYQLWKKAIKFVQKNQNQTFASLSNINSEFYSKQKIIFQAKLNKVYTSPRVIPYLDDGSINNRIIQLMQFIVRAQGFIDLTLANTVVKIIDNPVMQAMNQVGLINESRYYTFCQLTYQSYLLCMKQQIKKLKKNKLQYFIWKRNNWIQTYRTKYDLQYYSAKENLYYEYRKKQNEFHIQQYYFHKLQYNILHHKTVYESKYQNL